MVSNFACETSSSRGKQADLNPSAGESHENHRGDEQPQGRQDVKILLRRTTVIEKVGLRRRKNDLGLGGALKLEMREEEIDRDSIRFVPCAQRDKGFATDHDAAIVSHDTAFDQAG